MGEWGNGERHGLGKLLPPEAVPHILIPSFPHIRNHFFCGSLSSAVGPYIGGTFWSVSRR